MAEAGRRRVHVFVSGRVQGVWYRGSTESEARALGLAGWVRNLPDGRVEFVAEGSERAVARLIAWAHDGPPHALVTRVDVEEEEPTGAEETFSVRY
jgi:acylphosphatase